MASSQEPQLGQLAPKDAQRDAIHVALVPLVAGEDLYKGDEFWIKVGTEDVALGCDRHHGHKALGIVDPFYRDKNDFPYVREGQRFWGVLLPGTVTGMRHHWEHPDFDAPVLEPRKRVPVNESKFWLMEFAQRWRFDFDELINQACDVDSDWRYIVAGGIDLHSADELGEDHELFWFHLENFTGKSFSQEDRDGMGWSCSC